MITDTKLGCQPMKSAMGEGNWTDKQCLLQSQPVSLFPSHEPCSSPSAPVRTSRANEQTKSRNLYSCDGGSNKKKMTAAIWSMESQDFQSLKKPQCFKRISETDT